MFHGGGVAIESNGINAGKDGDSIEQLALEILDSIELDLICA